VPDLFSRAGGLRAAYEAVDWAATPLGAVTSWTPTLRNAVELALGTRFAVMLMWGPERVLLYNEAYVEMIGDKHPAALGAGASDVFPEAWDIIGPMVETVMGGHGATWVEDQYVPLRRSGFLEECYFTFSYSPVRGPDGSVEGLMDIAAETTTLVVVGRRLRLLTELGAALADVTDVPSLRTAALEALRTADLPAVELWLPGLPLDGEATVPALPDGADTAKELTVADDGSHAWLQLPVTHASARGTVLGVRLNSGRPLDEGYVDFLRLVAGMLARTTDRVLTNEAERTISTALQLSLLTQPARSERLEVAVRYLPAAELAQVGGDWYDAFRLPDGALTLVVGDVAGHDQHAAAAMAQIRNLTRGVAHSVDGTPAEVLAAVDRAMVGLDVGVVATALLFQVHDRDGVREARWSNAGHLPPVLIGPDGSSRLLETAPDLLLGLEPSLDRHDHAVELAPGSTLVLFTDGLVERRGVVLQDSLEWVAEELAGRQDHTAEELCEHLIGRVGTLADDVALLVVRVLG
jgi:hypothetical protein